MSNLSSLSGGVVHRPEPVLIVALDLPAIEDAEKMANLLLPEVNCFKVGPVLFTACGTEVVRFLREKGSAIFLDLKFHDIPSTVAGAAAAVTRLNTDIFNIHVTGGYDMMAATRDAVDDTARREGLARPKILGVTILTSLDQETCDRIYGNREPVRQRVVRMALEARRAGLDGVVASPDEIQPVREATGGDFLILTPGIRPDQSDPGDQRRICTPGEAVRRGADYLVVGRPITTAEDPRATALAIQCEMREAKEKSNKADTLSGKRRVVDA